MIEKIESKMAEIVETILAKPTGEVTKDEYEILAGEYLRQKAKINSAEQSKKMAEMVANLWTN